MDFDASKVPILGICGKAGSGKDTSAEYLKSRHKYCTISFADPLKQFAMAVFDFSVHSLWGPSPVRSVRDKRYKSYSPADPYWRKATERYHEYAPVWLGEVAGSKTKVAKLLPALDAWFHWLGTHHGDSISPRVVLQTLGTEFGRTSIGPQVWCNLALQTSKAILAGVDAAGNYIDYSHSDGTFILDRPNSYRGVVIADVRFPNELQAIRKVGGSVVKIVRESNIYGQSNHESETAMDTASMSDFGMIIHNNASIDSLYSAIDVYVSILEKPHP